MSIILKFEPMKDYFKYCDRNWENIVKDRGVFYIAKTAPFSGKQIAKPGDKITFNLYAEYGERYSATVSNKESGDRYILEEVRPEKEISLDELEEIIKTKKKKSSKGTKIIKVDSDHTIEKCYSDNGELISSINLKNGIKHGLSEIWATSEFGSTFKWLEENYKHGELHGKVKEWGRNLLLLKELKYKNGLLHGKCKFFDGKGSLESEGNYKEDKADGLHKKYIQNPDPKSFRKWNSTIIAHILYKNDKIISTKHYDIVGRALD